MPNPADTGEFENWLWDRQPAEWAPPRAGDTGDFERWVWNRQHICWYLETPTCGCTGFMTTVTSFWGQLP